GITALCVPVLYVISARMFRSPTAGAITAILGAIPDGTLGLTPAPGFYALTMLLLVLYSLLLRHDRRDVATTALAIVLATSLAMAHPITPIFAILAIVIAKLFMPVFRWLTRHAFVRASETSAERTPRMRMLFVYLTVTYLTWTGILTFAFQG